jgi:hypothetical protein
MWKRLKLKTTLPDVVRVDGDEGEGGEGESG